MISPSRVAFRHLSTSIISVEVRGPKDVLEIIEHEAKATFRVRKSQIQVIDPNRSDGRKGAHLMLIIDGDRDEIVEWCKEQASYDYSGDQHTWMVRENGKEISLRRASRLVEHFEIDGEEHRVRGLANNSGVRFSEKAGMRKWVLEHRSHRGRWIEDSATYLPNAAGVAKAKKQFGV